MFASDLHIGIQQRTRLNAHVKWLSYPSKADAEMHRYGDKDKIGCCLTWPAVVDWFLKPTNWKSWLPYFSAQVGNEIEEDLAVKEMDIEMAQCGLLQHLNHKRLLHLFCSIVSK